jgi:hypothetical protein
MFGHFRHTYTNNRLVKRVGPEREKQRICKYLLHCLQPSIWAIDHKTTLVYRLSIWFIYPNASYEIFVAFI